MTRSGAQRLDLGESEFVGDWPHDDCVTDRPLAGRIERSIHHVDPGVIVVDPPPSRFTASTAPSARRIRALSDPRPTKLSPQVVGVTTMLRA